MENKSLDQLLSNDIHSMLHEEIGYVFPEDSVIYTKILSRLEVILTKSIPSVSGVPSEEKINEEFKNEGCDSESDRSYKEGERDGAKWMRDRMLSLLTEKEKEVEELRMKKDIVYYDWEIDTEPPHKTEGKFVYIKDHLELIHSLQSELENEKFFTSQAEANVVLLKSHADKMASEINMYLFGHRATVSELKNAAESYKQNQIEFVPESPCEGFDLRCKYFKADVNSCHDCGRYKNNITD